jgi:hypothetical protein
MANVGKKGQAIKNARSQTGNQRAPVDVGINANHRQH